MAVLITTNPCLTIPDAFDPLVDTHVVFGVIVTIQVKARCDNA